MIIADELREYAQSWHETPNLMDNLDAGDVDGILADFERIADRIDAAYQKAEDEWKAKDGQMWLRGYGECRAELMEGNEAITASLEEAGWVRLPVGADGVPIRVGDKVTEHEDGHTFNVDGFMNWDGEWWVFMRDGVQAPARNCTHYHHPTVEDVLREFSEKIIDSQIPGMHPTYEEAIAEFAAKLRLAEEVRP